VFIAAHGVAVQGTPEWWFCVPEADTHRGNAVWSSRPRVPIVIAFTVLVAGNNPPKPGTAPSLAALAAKLAIGVGLTMIAIRQYRKLGRPKPPKKPPSGRRASTT
jgi:hypothetical protein